MIVGEPQILGQLKAAFAIAQQKRVAKGLIPRVFDRAFRVAKKVRSETGIAANAVSVSYAAVELARKIFGALHGRRMLVLGAGEMGALTLKHLAGAGVEDCCAVSTRCGTSGVRSSPSRRSVVSENGSPVADCPGEEGRGMPAAGFDATSASRIESRTKSCTND